MEIIQTRQVSCCAGFTLVELMISLTVAAVLLTVGIPGFKSFVLNQRVKTTAIEIMVNLNSARSEAIKLNRATTLQSKFIGGKPGWAVQVDGTDVHSFTIPDDVDVTVPVTTITFQPDGRSTAAAVFTICDRDNSAAVTRRTVRLGVSGRPNLKRGSDCDS